MSFATTLDKAQRLVLDAAYRGDPVHRRFAASVDSLGAMGYVCARVPTSRGWSVALTLEGMKVARALRNVRRWELWRDLYTSLQRRAAFEQDPQRKRTLARRSKLAYARAAVAVERLAPGKGASRG